jgi:hypothetical protein
MGGIFRAASAEYKCPVARYLAVLGQFDAQIS